MVEHIHAAPGAIVISLEAFFHGLLSPDWNSKLIQFPRGGLLWGLHLSKQQGEISNNRNIGCLICFGPVKETTKKWNIHFDHVFTLSHKKIGCAGTIQKNCCFSESDHIINNHEWGDDSTSEPVDWNIYDSIKLSCHLYISKTSGIDRDLLIGSADSNRAQENDAPETLTSAQVECQVMRCFGDLLLNESIKFSDEGLEAAEKLAVLFEYPNVIATIRTYLIRNQTEGSPRDTDEESKRILEFDLSGFDYRENNSYRRNRMSRLREYDIISMFQHLCAIAFKKNEPDF